MHELVAVRLGLSRVLLAHAGGFSWDEALLVLAPILLVGGVLFLANNRAKRLQGERANDRSDPVDAPADPPVDDIP